MANLRLVRIKAIDSTTIKAKFTSDLDPLINTSNIVITSVLSSIVDPAIAEIDISGAILTIKTRPMTPFAAYIVTFQSTDISLFRSVNGDAVLFEDGKTNAPIILGPEDPDDPIRKFLIDLLKGNVLNLQTGTLTRDIINSQSRDLAKALHSIQQAKNDNYLSTIISDEPKIRGTGPFDRLNEEGAYQILRVGKTTTNANLSASFSFVSFPNGLVTLLASTVSSETLAAGVGDSTFNNLTLTVENNFVTKLTSVTVTYADSSVATYDIRQFGYQVKNPVYDPEFASTLSSLDDNQFKLNSDVLDTEFIQPVVGDIITVAYEYKSKGRVIDEDSIVVSQVLDAVREPTPPLSTDFSLNNFPIVSASDAISTIAGVTWLDSQSNPPFSATHPAFSNEIPFGATQPRTVGEFSVDYETGRVFVYGAVTNDGTGNYPPTATYKYRRSFSSRLDYTFDPDTSDLVASPLRDLPGEVTKVSFDFEEALIPDVDFVPQVHNEVLDERIESRLASTNSLEVLRSPITNVFRIFNETSGEIYKVSRFNENKVFFTSSRQPRILSVEKERAAFTNVTNETMFVDEELTSGSSVRIFKILLTNNKIMAASEDATGSSYNTSAVFSRNDIFQTELFYDGQNRTVSENIDRLIPTKYQIDYINGIVYLAVYVGSNFDIGTISYKKSTITPDFPHLISVSEIYHSITITAGISETIEIFSFGENTIQPATFDRTDEKFLGADTTLPYLVSGSDTITVTDDIKNVRGVFDSFDLNNNDDPVNFAESATISANVITLDTTAIGKQESSVIGAGLVVPVTNISPGAEISSVISVIRLSDGEELFDTSGTFSGYDITLSGAGSPVAGQAANVIYTLKLNTNAGPVVDYNRGDYFVDYTYLADEILVSYEYGDNTLDFRESITLDPGDEYFVTYKVGALRNALLKNFGSLVDVPVLNNFNTTLPRERYRDALKAALQSFTQGPTIPSMTALVSNITHIDPEIKEAVFEIWSLGISYLFQNAIDYTGDIQLVPAKFDNGALLTNSGETITLPISSNLRLEEGTLETWVVPEWDGIDNDATLTFQLFKDGYSIDASKIFIGASSFNPTYDANNKFVLNRTDTNSPIGLPSAVFINTGFFIYYDEEPKVWKILAKDKVTNLDADGYIYSGSIETSGEFYDVKWVPGLNEIGDILRSGTTLTEFEFHIDAQDLEFPDGYIDGYYVGDGYDGYYLPGDGYIPGYSFDGFTFKSDDEHYIFDFGKTETTNRFSLYKDGKGYLNFRVMDRGNSITDRVNRYFVTTDISDWLAGEQHFIALSWKLNTYNRRDEMHLFVDGLEVPNILRFGGRPIASLTDRFRTVKPEVVAGAVPLKIITYNDLSTTAGSTTVVSASIDFQAEGIVAGHTINILELGFDTYIIQSVIGSILVLDTPALTTLSDARFSINEFAVVVESEIDLMSNIIVSIIDATTSVETEIPGVRADVPGYSISKNLFNQNILTFLGNANAGDQITIRTLGLNHRRCRETQFIWGDSLNIIKTQLPPPILLDEVSVIPVVLNKFVLGPDTATLSGGIFTATGIAPLTQPSNETEGRNLAVRINGNNVNFSPAVEVIINGTTAGGPLFEKIEFSKAITKNTSNKFLTVTSITISAKPIVTTSNSITVDIKESASITKPGSNSIFPVIRFSFKTQTNSTLEGDGSVIVSDPEGFFPESAIDQILVISSPAPVAGTYTITDRISNTSVSISPAPGSSFSSGIYDIYNTSIGRSGFQNGFFTFELAGAVATPYLLKQGLYEFDYSAFLEVPFDPISDEHGYIGSDLNGNSQSKAAIDEFRILSKMMTDTRIGESIALTENSITTDFAALNKFESDDDTLTLIHFDNFPFENDNRIIISAEKEFIQSGESINTNFDKSIVIANKPLIRDNTGLLLTHTEGSIEFWVSPRVDSYNDPNFRFYFDAASSIVEEVVSVTSGSVQVSSSISSVLSVRLQTDIQNTGTNFFDGGSIEDDFKTIRLGRALPSQKTPVKVSYIMSGLSGDRISIFKDMGGSLIFNIRVGEQDFQVRKSIFWPRDTWHRIMCTYKLNSANNLDEIRMFIDGEEGGIICFGTGLLFGQGIVFAQSLAGAPSSLVGDMNFADPINKIHIGADYTGANPAQARIDNLRLSDIARIPSTIVGQPRDINYSSSLSTALPVIEDAFTTFLLNFDSVLFETDDFAIIRDEKFGIFNFTINAIDSFNIVSSNSTVEQILEDLVNALKPAQSRVTLNIVK